MATATLAAATQRAAYRSEQAYQSGQRDGLEVIRTLAAECANRAEYVAALRALAQTARAAFRKHPGGFWLGQLDAVRDVARG